MSTATDTAITLAGSTSIVTEFFHYAINSILYQRGIYEPETFKRENKYGLTVLTSTDEGLLSYLGSIMGQMEAWMMKGEVQVREDEGKKKKTGQVKTGQVGKGGLAAPF